MKKRVEQYIPDAINILVDVGIAENGKVNNKFHGYFSSFGASIVLSGIKPALAFYSNKKDEERVKILKAIYKLITGNDELSATALLNYFIENENNDPLLKQKIMDAAVALKLAVRTYELIKD